MTKPSFSIRTPSRKAFTLIEMLSAIGVIAILAGLTVPALTGTLDASRNVRSVANMRQIGAIVLTYSADNNGSLPSGWDPDTKQQWYVQMKQAGYLNPPAQRSLLVCPLMDRKYGSENVGTPDSYAMNNNLGGMRTQQFPRPAETSFLFNSFYFPGKHTWNYAATANSADHTIIPAYKNLVNVLFLDNSIREMSASDPMLLGQNGGKGTPTRLFWQGNLD